MDVQSEIFIYICDTYTKVENRRVTLYYSLRASSFALLNLYAEYKRTSTKVLKRVLDPQSDLIPDWARVTKYPYYQYRQNGPIFVAFTVFKDVIL